MTFALWLTGPPAAGKTTIARLVEARLAQRQIHVEVLDADEVRRELWPELGYGPHGRDENTRRLVVLAQMLQRRGAPVVIAAVAPERRLRDRARGVLAPFAEVWVTARLETLRARDPKGLYRRASVGQAVDVPGVHLSYEPPLAPEITLDTDRHAADECAERVVAWLESRGWLKT